MGKTAWQMYASALHGSRGLLHFLVTPCASPVDCGDIPHPPHGRHLVQAGTGRKDHGYPGLLTPEGAPAPGPIYDISRRLNSVFRAWGPTLMRLRTPAGGQLYLRYADGAQGMGRKLCAAQSPLVNISTGDYNVGLFYEEALGPASGISAIMLQNHDAANWRFATVIWRGTTTPSGDVSKVLEVDGSTGRAAPVQDAATHVAGFQVVLDAGQARLYRFLKNDDDAPTSARVTRPTITTLGTYDLLLVETTPLVVHGELYLFESVRSDYWNHSGTENLRFVHMLSGTKTPSFGAGHALGCALAEDGGAHAGVYAFGTKREFGVVDSGGAAPGQIISVFHSTDGMITWQTKTAVDFSKEKSPSRSKRVVFNTSVGRGKINGTVCYVMAYEWSRPGTPGGWNTNFALSHDSPMGPWRLLDEDVFGMPADVEHADPTIRYVEADGYWYCIPARKDPAKWQFFQEIYRSKDLRSWEAAPGMGSVSAVGQPLLGPPTSASALLDKAVAPREWHPDLFDALQALKASKNWTTWEDCNSSDMDLCQWKNQVRLRSLSFPPELGVRLTRISVDAYDLQLGLPARHGGPRPSALRHAAGLVPASVVSAAHL